MSARFMADLVQQIDGVEYVKEETPQAPQVMTELLSLAGPSTQGHHGWHGRALPVQRGSPRRVRHNASV